MAGSSEARRGAVSPPLRAWWPRSIHGVDFSGAVLAGRAIWITSAVGRAEGLRVTACRPAAALPDSGAGREAALTALRRLIAADPDGVFALDFPFGLPWPLVGRFRTWAGFVADFPHRYPTPEGFRAACRAAAPGRELKRSTDREARAPFSPYNLRMYRQTYHGIRDVLAPLIAAGQAVAPPMQPPAAGKPWLLEICPAVSLKDAGLYHPYKGPGPQRRAMRLRILRAYSGDGSAHVPRRLREVMVDNPGGDALDSLIAAHTAWRLLHHPAALATPLTREQAVEAMILRAQS